MYQRQSRARKRWPPIYQYQPRSQLKSDSNRPPGMPCEPARTAPGVLITDLLPTAWDTSPRSRPVCR